MTELGETFDTNVAGYRQYRPGYPEAIRNKIIEVTGIRDGCRILEVGCGTGQATGFFSGLKPKQTSIDPGANMIWECQKDFPEYEFICCRFEDYPDSPSSFDLIYAVTSFHWVTRGVRFPKVQRLLKPGAHLAIVTDRHVKHMEGFFTDVQEIYQSIAPDVVSPFNPKAAEEIEENPLSLVHESEMDRQLIYSADEYIGLLRTFSGHIALGTERLNRLCTAIHDLIEIRYSGKIQKTLTSYLSIYRNV